MSHNSKVRSEEFLKISEQFQLGVLTTESSHPATAHLSEAAHRDIAAGLDQLFQVDQDVLRKYHEFLASGRAAVISRTLVSALVGGGKVFFTGCGSTGRLSIQLVSIWRDFWQRQRVARAVDPAAAEEFENRAHAVMAGGDYALIKAVEGFEDFTDFGKKQIGDLGVSSRDVVFAITEGGETSFVIGTAWKGVEVGAKVYFVYNNPDDVLCRHVQRSRDVIQDARIEKINLTTGPMAITGSTRMQATTIQLAVLLTVLEMVVRDLQNALLPPGAEGLDPAAVPAAFEKALTQMFATLKSRPLLAQLARLVALEESIYRAGHKNNYFADRFGIDVLTDTTERSPTYCTPPFRKFDDKAAGESWAFLFVPHALTQEAWHHIIKRHPRCIEWTREEVQALVGPDKLERTYETVRKIGNHELMRFKVGLDGLQFRHPGRGDGAVGILSETEKRSLLLPDGFQRMQLQAAAGVGARTGLVYLAHEESLKEMEQFLHSWNPDCASVMVPVPYTDFLLDGVTPVGLKTLLNALSTCTMVRLGRVMGNYMIWVVPSNLKLIDRATRYIERLTGLNYAEANHLLFEVIEYVEPRMKADQAYPPVVGVAVTRIRHGVGNHDAEQLLLTNL